MGKRYRYFLKFCLLIFFLIIGLFIAEGISRIFIPKEQLMHTTEMYEPSETRGWKLKPGVDMIFSDMSDNKEFEQHIKINSKGFRDYEYDYEKPVDTFRIIILGDSMTAALEVPLEDTFENILEKKLNEKNEKKYSKYEVLNFGIKAYGTSEEFIALEEEGLKYNPEMVILNFCVGNDFWNNIKSSIFVLEDNTLIRNANAPIKLASLRSFLARKSALYNLMSSTKSALLRGEQIDEFNKWVEILKPANQREVDFNPELTHQIIKEFNNFLKERNIDLIIVIIPTKEQVDENKLKELLEEYGEVGMDLDLEWSIRQLEEIGRFEAIPVINLFPEMKKENKDNNLYFDVDVHFTKEGNHVVGELLYNQLTEKELIT